MEFKGTKGKWVIEYSNRDDSYDIYSENKEEFVCTTMNSLDLEKYNAQLIAHAPEMLEKLTECKTMFSKGKRLTTTDMAMMVDDITDLLTKATTI